MNKQLVKEVAAECTKRGNMPVKLNRALHMQQGMQKDDLDDATMIDAFSILMSWKGRRVYVDGLEWIPPLIEGSVQ